MYFDLNIIGNKSVYDFVVTSTNIFLNNLLYECKGNCTITSDVSVAVIIKTSSPDLSLNWRTEEGYSIELTTKGKYNFY